MIRKYHNHKLQTTPWHRDEEPLNHHETPGRQIKQSNQHLYGLAVKFGFYGDVVEYFDFRPGIPDHNAAANILVRYDAKMLTW